MTTMTDYRICRAASALTAPTKAAARTALRAAGLPIGANIDAVLIEHARQQPIRKARRTLRQCAAQIPLAERLRRRRVARIRQAALQALRVGEHDTMSVCLTTDPQAVGVSQSECVDRDLYRGRYKGWACKYWATTITVPADWRARVERDGLQTVDGMLTLDAAPLEAVPDDTECFAARWIEQGRGNSVHTRRGYIARSAGLSYHGVSAEQALAGLRRKISGARWATTLRSADLAPLVGSFGSLPVRVADATAVGACDYGIRAWCAAVGLDYAAGCATLTDVHTAYLREPRAEARAAMLHALRRARRLPMAA